MFGCQNTNTHLFFFFALHDFALSKHRGYTALMWPFKGNKLPPFKHLRCDAAISWLDALFFFARLVSVRGK
jgi:hypothetical protein